MFDFRNDIDKGASPYTVADCILVHNYAIQFLALKKYNGRTPTFWSQTPSPHPVGPIKAKLAEYLQGIDHRLKILSDTPRNNFNGTIVKCVQKGLLADYDTKKAYDKQKTAEQDILLAMDEGTCDLYGESSRAFEKNIDVASKENIELLASLAVMELQFMLGCGIGWSTGGDDNDTAAGPAISQVLSNGSQDDDRGGDNAGGGDKEELEAADEEEKLDFASINVDNILDELDWEHLEYPDAKAFVSHRESLAMAVLFFLSEDLGDKCPKLKGQVHAGWLEAFKTPITMDQLLDPPAAIDFEFTESEEDWLQCTMQTLVKAISKDRMEAMGITPVHLAKLHITPPPSPKVSPIQSPSLCCNSLRLT